MKRATIIVKGEVQRVGYRDAVEKKARKLNITGFVENLKHYDVRIVAEGEDANIDQFIEQLEIKKIPIDVESTEVSFEPYKSEFEYFEIKRGDWHEELFERLDTAGALLYKSVELGEKSVALGEESVSIGKKTLGKQDMMLEKQDSMLGKQDDTIEAIRGVSEKIDSGKEEIVTEISSLRGDLRSYMENKFSKIEQEIEGIKVKIGMT
ncbi:acylphosphatase [ANME-1 cluster archaeon GoMg4]|nr:acylphosphatase [ANME-1 cluster archaeon GoMg4]